MRRVVCEVVEKRLEVKSIEAEIKPFKSALFMKADVSPQSATLFRSTLSIWVELRTPLKFYQSIWLLGIRLLHYIEE